MTVATRVATMATWKVLGMVLLVVLPGGSLLLLAYAAFQAWRRKQRQAAEAKPASPPVLTVVPRQAEVG